MLIFLRFHFFQNHFDNLLLITNNRLIPALAIPTGVPMTAVNEQEETPLLAPRNKKTNKMLLA